MHLLPIATGRKLLSGIVHFGAVIPEIDIWRAAQLMLKRYGDQALKESAARATELTLAGDDDGRRHGTRSWKPSLNSLTQRPRCQCTDQEKNLARIVVPMERSWQWVVAS